MNHYIGALTPVENRLYAQLAKKHKGLVNNFSYLRIENPIINNQSLYKFPILNQGNELSVEKKIDKNDLFVATRLGLFIYSRSTATGDQAAQPLQTYPNEAYFPAVAGFVPSHLETVYSGELSIKKGTTVILESYDTMNFRYAPTTQQSVATNKSERGRDTGFAGVTPTMELPGREQVSIEAKFNTFNGIQWQAVTANTEHRLVLYIRGFLVKGANI